MLSDDAIETLIQPISDRQKLINIITIQMIADKLGEIGALTPQDIDRLKILVECGTDIQKLNNEIVKLYRLQIRDIGSILTEVAFNSYNDAEPLYEYRRTPFIQFSQNKEIQTIISTIRTTVTKEYKKLVSPKVTGFLIDDPKYYGKLKFQPVGTAYKTVVNKAIQSAKSGADYRKAIRKSIKQLLDSGVRSVVWDSGYTQRLDTAVRRCVLDGIHSIQQGVEDEIGKQINADGKELSVHINCALDHEPIQGHIFTNAEYYKLQNNDSFEDINGKKFEALDRIIGIWNCRHVAYSFIIGVSKPRYTQKQLDEYIRRNHEGYVLPNGKHITMYECTQMQRQMETKIRYAKEAQMVYKQAGNLDDARKARRDVVRLTEQYKIFSKNCGLKISKDRTSVPGYIAIKI